MLLFSLLCLPARLPACLPLVVFWPCIRCLRGLSTSILLSLSCVYQALALLGCPFLFASHASPPSILVHALRSWPAAGASHFSFHKLFNETTVSLKGGHFKRVSCNNVCACKRKTGSTLSPCLAVPPATQRRPSPPPAALPCVAVAGGLDAPVQHRLQQHAGQSPPQPWPQMPSPGMLCAPSFWPFQALGI